MSNLGFFYGEKGDSGPILVNIIPGPPLPPTSLPNVVTPEQFGAVGDGVTNDYAAVQAAVATGKNVFFGGKYLVNGASPAINVVTPNQRLFGFGDESQILTTSNITVIKIVQPAEGASVESLRITGNGLGAAQNGIGASDLAGGQGVRDLRILNVTFENLANAGLILFNAPGGQVVGPQIIGCRVTADAAHGITTTFGMWIVVEYTTIVGCVIGQGVGVVEGLRLQAGNIMVSGSEITRCTNIGVHIVAAGNDGHGAIVGCEINHNGNLGAGSANVLVDDTIANGMPFVGCNIYGAATRIAIGVAGPTHGIRFVGCAIDVAEVDLAAGTLGTVFAGCLWPQGVIPGPPVVNVGPGATVRFDAFNVDLSGQLPAFIALIADASGTAFQSLVQGIMRITPGVAAPAAPTAGFFLYVDVADHKLKAIGPGGTITPLANP